MVEEDSIMLATWPLGLAEQHHAGQNWQGQWGQQVPGLSCQGLERLAWLGAMDDRGNGSAGCGLRGCLDWRQEVS